MTGVICAFQPSTNKVGRQKCFHYLQCLYSNSCYSYIYLAKVLLPCMYLLASAGLLNILHLNTRPARIAQLLIQVVVQVWVLLHVLINLSFCQKTFCIMTIFHPSSCDFLCLTVSCLVITNHEETMISL